jgi:Cu+-exporting ATPase
MSKQLIIEIEGMTCSNCARKVESALSKINGLNKSSVNAVNHSSLVDTDDNISEEDIKAAVKSVGYKVTQIDNL